MTTLQLVLVLAVIFVVVPAVLGIVAWSSITEIADTAIERSVGDPRRRRL